MSSLPDKPVVAVFDRKVGLFDPPVVTRHIGEALREFDTLSKDPNTKFGKHPEDFDLYQIATYNEATGLFTAVTPHTHLTNGVQ